MKFHDFLDPWESEQSPCGLWKLLRRPYYNLWPSVVRPFSKTSIDVPASMIRFPVDALVIRYAKGHELRVGQWSCETIICCNRLHNEALGPAASKLLTVICGIVRYDPLKRLFQTIGQAIRRDSGETVEESFMARPYRDQDEFRGRWIGAHPGAKEAPNLKYEDHTLDRLEQMKNAIVRTACCVALLGKDSEIVTPDVLTGDQLKYDETGDERYVKKAIQRGKFGFNIGKHMEHDETSPHYRRPHFAIRWMGEGGQRPELRPVKGCNVKRTLIGQVPTGYLDDEVSE